MAQAAERHADYTIICDDNPRHEDPESIIRDIAQGFNNPQSYDAIADRKIAIETAMSHLKAGDILLIAGKGAEKEQIYGSQKIPFSDHVIVRKYQ